MLDFRPPLESPALIWYVNLVLPLYMKLKLHDTRVTIKEGALERFAKLKGKHAMICPNHSNRHDPQVVGMFARAAGEHFNFVAAREVFDYDNGANGWWLQHLGVYSVVRGAADRESFKTTRRILSEGRKKLVLFPEGELSRQNDTVMPLESGAAQMAFWAMQDMEKGGAKIGPGEDEKTVYIQPIAMKYTYPYDVSSSLRETLKTLENKLGIVSPDDFSFYNRMRALAEKMLGTIEKEYGITTNAQPPLGMNERLKALRRHILNNLARILEIELPKDARDLECVRILRNKLDDFIFEDEKKMTEYERHVHEEKQRVYKSYYRDLNRVVTFICIYDGYVTEHMTQERYSDVIERMEIEIFDGDPTIKGPREILIDVGEAIDLSAYYADFKKEKKATIAKVTDLIFSEISTMLTKLDEGRTHRFIDAKTLV
ncbi:MAG: 1-acyl-sn-glycerol-3-phosphate acyltransferase [Cyanobacteriota bacterium erpe_2018_sw_21hr_WHONDRS-SW48-000092_B_bin.40]|nr:1-acyl-sn-glycerol-3-phosphate acyltransferase [Cyanobacteriota bacterium erpe_2018_sw_21hr_WHONDRS-SW48-000092_B_bin.40]